MPGVETRLRANQLPHSKLFTFTCTQATPLQVPSASGAPCLLADFLADPPQATTAIVAEDPSATARALVAINTDVDCNVLLQHFDLSAYDGLIEVEQYEALVADAERELAAERQAEADKKHQTLVVRPCLPLILRRLPSRGPAVLGSRV